MPSRHRSRERALQMLYQWDLTKAAADRIIEAFWERFSSDTGGEAGARDVFADQLVQGVIQHIDQIDQLIRTYASNWRLERMSMVDRSILRIATYEMLHETAEAPVVINEAIELGRRFSGQDASPFLNGVLDAIRRSIEETRAARIGS